MKRLVIAGGGAGGTALANRARRGLPREDWRVIVVEVVEPTEHHLREQGLVRIALGLDPARVQRARARTFSSGVEWVRLVVETARKHVDLFDGRRVEYDILVVASGSRARRDLTPGLEERNPAGAVCDFQTFSGAQALCVEIERFMGGRVIACVLDRTRRPALAALEFLFLLDDWLRRRSLLLAGRGFPAQSARGVMRTETPHA